MEELRHLNEGYSSRRATKTISVALCVITIQTLEQSEGKGSEGDSEPVDEE